MFELVDNRVCLDKEGSDAVVVALTSLLFRKGKLLETIKDLERSHSSYASEVIDKFNHDVASIDSAYNLLINLYIDAVKRM